MHFIESSITVEAKITQLMMTLELLDAREPNSVNQVNPTFVISMDCTYCHALTHLFEEYPVYQAQHIFPENMNAAYTKPNYNSYSKIYNQDGEIIQTFLEVSLVLSSHDNSSTSIHCSNPSTQFPSELTKFSVDLPTQLPARLPTSATKSSK